MQLEKLKMWRKVFCPCLFSGMEFEFFFPWDELIKEIRLPNNVTKAAELEAPLSQYFIKVFLYNSLFFNDLDS